MLYFHFHHHVLSQPSQSVLQCRYNLDQSYERNANSLSICLALICSGLLWAHIILLQDKLRSCLNNLKPRKCVRRGKGNELK